MTRAVAALLLVLPLLAIATPAPPVQAAARRSGTLCTPQVTATVQRGSAPATRLPAACRPATSTVSH